MVDIISAIDRLATKLRVRPVAAWVYWRLRELKEIIRDLRYRKHRLRSDTYHVTVGDAEAEFYTLTRQEFLDHLHLKEQPILADLLSRIRPDDVFYDIGANIGVYTCLIADVVDSQVVAVEPHPNNADRLEQNIELNGASASVYRSAFAASAGTAELRLSPGWGPDKLGSAGHSLVDHRGEDTETIPVETIPGDNHIADEELPPPTVMKIDVEGAEMDVLKGLESTLARSECRLVYCEVHEDPTESERYLISEVTNCLKATGFSVDEQVIEGYQTFVRAEKQTPRDSDPSRIENQTTVKDR